MDKKCINCQYEENGKCMYWYYMGFKSEEEAEEVCDYD